MVSVEIVDGHFVVVVVDVHRQQSPYARYLHRSEYLSIVVEDRSMFDYEYRNRSFEYVENSLVWIFPDVYDV